MSYLTPLAGPPALPAPPHPIDSQAAWSAAVLWTLQAASARQARRLWLVDPDFAEWPLGDVAVLDALQAFVRQPQRQLLLLAQRYDEFPRRHPRFVAWRRDWAHTVQAWAPPEAGPALPSLAVDDGPVCLQRLALTPVRARAVLNAAEARRCREQLDAVLQQSSPAFPVQTLGL